MTGRAGVDLRMPRASLFFATFLVLLALAVDAVSADQVKDSCLFANFCFCKDDLCNQCSSSFGGCCYHYRASADPRSPWNCSSFYPPQNSSIVHRQCSSSCTFGVDKPCARCEVMEEVLRCTRCSRSYQMVPSGDIHACCALENPDSTDKVIAGVTLGMIGLGSLATVAILLWALFVRRRSRSSGDDEGLLIN